MRTCLQIDYAPFLWRWVISSYTGTTVGNAPRYVLEELRKQLDLVPDKALLVFRVSVPPPTKTGSFGDWELHFRELSARLCNFRL